MHERAKTMRSGSPAEATTVPSASHTTTWPLWIDSVRPPRTTRTSGTTGSAQDERGILAVPALQLVLQRVQHPDHVAASRGHLTLLGGEEIDRAREVRIVQRAG